MTGHGKARVIGRPRNRGPLSMKFTWFNLMPWPYLPDDFRRKHHSVWVDIPSSLYDPVKGHALYNTYLDELEYGEGVVEGRHLLGAQRGQRDGEPRRLARHGRVDLGLQRRPVLVGGLLQPALEVPDVLGLRVLLAAQRAERCLGRTPQLVGVEGADPLEQHVPEVRHVKDLPAGAPVERVEFAVGVEAAPRAAVAKAASLSTPSSISSRAARLTAGPMQVKSNRLPPPILPYRIGPTCSATPKRKRSTASPTG